MKRVNQGDINFKLDSRIASLDEFVLRFYTVNSESFFIRKTQNDIIEVVREATCEDNTEESTVTDYYIKLEWVELVTLGEGVLNYRLYYNTPDSDRPDGEYNVTVTKSTNYFIASHVIVDEEESESYAQIIAELGDDLQSEISRSTSADTTLNNSITAETQARISGDSELQTAINNEANTRQSNVSALTDAITAETQARINADTALSGAIPTTSQEVDAMPRKVFLGNPRENYFADGVYISVLDNALFAANRRFNVSCVITDTNGNIVSRNVSYDGLFNSNYDDSTALMVAEGETAVLTIMGGSTFDETRFSDITYTSGYIYLHCYGQKFPSKVTGRLYSKNASTLGWHSFTFAPMENSSCVLVANIGNWPIPTALELTIEGANYIGQSPAMAAITEIEWDTKRHFTAFGVVSKGRSETIYFPLKVNNTVTVSQSVTAQSFIRSGGTNSQVLLASGSVRNINDFQANWNQATTTALDYIKNKPTNVSAFVNDSGYISSSTVTSIVTMTQAQYDDLTIKNNNTIYNIIEE